MPSIHNCLRRTQLIDISDRAGDQSRTDIAEGSELIAATLTSAVQSQLRVSDAAPSHIFLVEAYISLFCSSGTVNKSKPLNLAVGMLIGGLLSADSNPGPD